MKKVLFSVEHPEEDPTVIDPPRVGFDLKRSPLTVE